jgi:hypothetical protein
MYLRITRVHYDPARYDDVILLAREVNAAMQRQPRCQAFYQGTDRTTGTTAAVSIWDTEDPSYGARIWVMRSAGCKRSASSSIRQKS